MEYDIKTKIILIFVIILIIGLSFYLYIKFKKKLFNLQKLALINKLQLKNDKVQFEEENNIIMIKKENNLKQIDKKPIKKDKKPIETDVKPIETYVKPIETYVKPIETDVKPIETDVKPIETDVKPIETDVKTIETDVKPIETDLKLIETDVKPIETDVKPIETDLKLIEEEEEEEEEEETNVVPFDKENNFIPFEKETVAEQTDTIIKPTETDVKLTKEETGVVPFDKETVVEQTDTVIKANQTNIKPTETDTEKNETVIEANQTIIKPTETDTEKNETVIEANQTNIKPIETDTEKNETVIEANQTNIEQTETEILQLDKKEVVVDCQGNWSEWSSCKRDGKEVTCGDATRTRTFNVSVNSENGGETCPEDQQENCNLKACPVDCQGEWSEWSSCKRDGKEVTCGDATRTRTFNVSVNSENDGETCPEDQQENCNLKACSVDCQGNWSEWSSCKRDGKEVTCGDATRTRTFNVSVNAENGGETCPEDQQENCNLKACPVDCQGEWSEWSSCKRDGKEVTCGDATRTRTFNVSVNAENGGETCPEDQQENCNLKACPVDCQGEWSEWSSCKRDGKRSDLW